jgi:predicted nucleic acid-binding Zn ribbon protein
MARHYTSEDDWDDDSDDEDTMPCPYCSKSIHEDSVRCPYCENYLSAEDQPYRPKPLWIILTVIACLAAVVMWIWLG